MYKVQNTGAMCCSRRILEIGIKEEWIASSLQRKVMNPNLEKQARKSERGFQGWKGGETLSALRPHSDTSRSFIIIWNLFQVKDHP